MEGPGIAGSGEVRQQSLSRTQAHDLQALIGPHESHYELEGQALLRE